MAIPMPTKLKNVMNEFEKTGLTKTRPPCSRS